MNEYERTKLLDGLDEAFRNGTVAAATPEQLQRWLISLCTGSIPNPTVHPREIVRGITINHIQMAQTIYRLEQTIERLDAGNKRTQNLVIILTVVAVIVGIVQTAATIAALFR